jgi:hypothetical protein
MRKYIDLIEATLYRGDASEIEAFDTAKTYDNALFGRGIYLTDNRDVAGDYTVNKGAIEQIVSNPREEYRSQRDAIAGVIMDIMNKDLGWAEIKEKLKDEHAPRWQNNEVPGFPNTRVMRYGEPGYEEARAKHQQDFQDALLVEYGAALRKAKRIYKQRAVDYRVVRDTMNRWTVVKADRPGRVSRFDIPDDYLAKTLHGDNPMTDAEVKIVGKFVEQATPHGTDFRDANNQQVKGENGAHNFWKWVEVFKKSGSEYAWRDGKDRLMGGKGENPSLDQIWNGQHGGFSIFYKSGDSFIEFMQQSGYTGIQYHGGVRIGDNVRGGGGIRHTSYVLWDSDYVTKCRVDQEAVVDAPLDYDPKKLLARSLYMKHREPDKY